MYRNFYDRVFRWEIENRDETFTKDKVAGRIAVFLDLLKKNSIIPFSIIDLGCSDGSLSGMLSDKKIGEKFTLIDISKRAIDYVKSHPFAGLNEARIADIYALPYRDNEFDLAIMSNIVEHLSHPWDAVVEATRIASNVLLDIPLADAMLSNAAAWVRKHKEHLPRSVNPVGHLHFFSDVTFRKAMEQMDAVVVEDGIRYVPHNRSILRHALTKLLGPRGYGYFLTTHMAYLIRSTAFRKAGQ